MKSKRILPPLAILFALMAFGNAQAQSYAQACPRGMSLTLTMGIPKCIGVMIRPNDARLLQGASGGAQSAGAAIAAQVPSTIGSQQMPGEYVPAPAYDPRTDPRFMLTAYNTPNPEAANLARQAQSNPAFAASFAAQNNWSQADYNSWMTRVLNPEAWAAQAARNDLEHGIVAGPGSYAPAGAASTASAPLYTFGTGQVYVPPANPNDPRFSASNMLTAYNSPNTTALPLALQAASDANFAQSFAAENNWSQADYDSWMSRVLTPDQWAIDAAASDAANGIVAGPQ